MHPELLEKRSKESYTNYNFDLCNQCFHVKHDLETHLLTKYSHHGQTYWNQQKLMNLFYDGQPVEVTKDGGMGTKNVIAKESTILVADKESKEIETETETERDKVDTDFLLAEERETESDKVDTDSAIRGTIILVAEEIEPEGDKVDTDTGLNETTIEVEILEFEDNESEKYKGTVIKDSDPKLPIPAINSKDKETAEEWMDLSDKETSDLIRRRTLGLEDARGKSEERNELLRGQVELTQGHYRDLPGEPTTGLPIVISFRADETLTSFFTNPGNSIGMLRCTAGDALRSTLALMNPDLGPLSRYLLHEADSGQSVQSPPPSNTSCDGFSLRTDAMGECATRMEGKTFTHFLTLDSAESIHPAEGPKVPLPCGRGHTTVTDLCDGGSVLC